LGVANFDTNATGARGVRIDTSSTANPASTAGGAVQPASGSTRTIIRTARILPLTETTTVYVVASQTSGTTLSVTGRLEAFKLK
jgi:hypothetical protein